MAFVIEELFKHFFNADTILIITQQLNEKINQQTHDNSEGYTKYKATLSMLNKSRSNLLQAHKNTGYSNIGEELKNVESQIERCTAFLQELDEKYKDIPLFTEEKVRQKLPGFQEFAKLSERKEIRSMIQSYVDRVTVYNDKVEVTYKVAFPFAQKSIPYIYKTQITRSMLEEEETKHFYLLNFKASQRYCMQPKKELLQMSTKIPLETMTQ